MSLCLLFSCLGVLNSQAALCAECRNAPTLMCSPVESAQMALCYPMFCRKCLPSAKQCMSGRWQPRPSWEHAPVQACSILYKTKLPLLLAFNKIDVVRHEFAVEWMKDCDAFNKALQRDTTYAATLSRSLSLVRPLGSPL